MKKKNFLLCICMVLLCAVLSAGCTKTSREGKEQMNGDEQTEVENNTGTGMSGVPVEDAEKVSPESDMEAPVPQTEEADWSSYFDGLNGVAVIYDPSNNKYMIYNKELANTRRSPCSTFKIISSLTALEDGTIVPEDSTRSWSGEEFWNEDWNKDIDFEEAFRTSCVWYFREVIDEIGKERMQEALDTLSYGNCDISDWEGRQNTNNDNRALTGFWIESSLQISPKEQTEVMERIFGKDTIYSGNTIEELKNVMRAEEQNIADCTVYGKTGTGKAHGVLADAWFTGFAETPEGNVYFCVYLGENEGEDVSSTDARQIAMEILTDYCDHSL